jgi:hypothetical protein
MDLTASSAVNLPITSASLAVGCRLDGSPINPLHVFSSVGTVTVHFHDKFRVFHGFVLG